MLGYVGMDSIRWCLGGCLTRRLGRVGGLSRVPTERLPVLGKDRLLVVLAVLVVALVVSVSSIRLHAAMRTVVVSHCVQTQESRILESVEISAFAVLSKVL